MILTYEIVPPIHNNTPKIYVISVSTSHVHCIVEFVKLYISLLMNENHIVEK